MPKKNEDDDEDKEEKEEPFDFFKFFEDPSRIKIDPNKLFKDKNSKTYFKTFLIKFQKASLQSFRIYLQKIL